MTVKLRIRLRNGVTTEVLLHDIRDGAEVEQRVQSMQLPTDYKVSWEPVPEVSFGSVPTKGVPTKGEIVR